jgi:hypothetical protein
LPASILLAQAAKTLPIMKGLPNNGLLPHVPVVPIVPVVGKKTKVSILTVPMFGMIVRAGRPGIAAASARHWSTRVSYFPHAV